MAGRADGWNLFRCVDDSYSLSYPPEWEEFRPPVSEGASLSCGVPYTLLEGFAYEWNGPPEPGGPDLVTVLGDAIAETAGTEVGQSNGKVIRRDATPFRNAERCERVVVSYTDRGLRTTTDYCVVGSGKKAVQIALKVLSSNYDEMLPVFERILASLETPWLKG